jgi:hypothetical protein
MSNHPELRPISLDDWDTLIDNPFNIGPFSRSIKADDWWVITGMHVRLRDALADRPAGTSKLLILADTISSVSTREKHHGIQFYGLSEVLLFADTFNLLQGGNLFSHDMPDGGESFRIAVLGRTLQSHQRYFHFVLNGGWRNGRHRSSDEHLWHASQGPRHIMDGLAIQEPHQIELYYSPEHERYYPRKLPLPDSGPHFDACGAFLARLLLTAQSLFDTGRADHANRLLGRLEALVALNPGVASWQEVAAQCTATREMLEPQLPGSDLVPDLSPGVYGGVAESYGPALKAFADRFDQFVDRTTAVQHRKAAANLMLKKEDNAIIFQGLVRKQLEDNLKAANGNLSRATTSMESQSKRVEEAERAFQTGLGAWREEKKREADLAIAGVVLSAVGGLAMIAAGKPPDISGMLEKAEKIHQVAVMVVKLLAKLAKIIKVVALLMKTTSKILPEASKIINSRDLAARMANVRRESAESDLDGAPSESASWDQFWEQIDTALRPAVLAEIPGAAEYLQHMKVLIIYGRALTSARAAIPPIAQELAQAHLLTKLAEEQGGTIAKQIETLQTGTASSALAVALWIRHRSVRRAVFAALQDFDAAHRYWALTVERPQRNPSRSIKDLAGDLLDIANIKNSEASALKSFDPSPQKFKESFEVPVTAVADLLRDGSFALRFTPDRFPPDVDPVAGWGPVAGLGKLGRVRVLEVWAWVIWNEGKRLNPMEFTIRTDGDYYDQRVESGEVKEFRFIGPRVNKTFKYNPVKAEDSRADSISAWARVAEDFSHLYSQPTLFTGWEFSLPKVQDRQTKKYIIDPKILEALQGAVKGIELEFSGTYIKDGPRF